jgi:hypothetical protein
LGKWKLVAHGEFFPEQPAAKPVLELYDLGGDPAEQTDLAAREPELVAQLHRRLREFGTWQKAGVGPYIEGRDGFTPPKDWIAGAAPDSSDARSPAKGGKKKKKAGK